MLHWAFWGFFFLKRSRTLDGRRNSTQCARHEELFCGDHWYGRNGKDVCTEAQRCRMEVKHTYPLWHLRSLSLNRPYSKQNSRYYLTYSLQWWLECIWLEYCPLLAWLPFWYQVGVWLSLMKNLSYLNYTMSENIPCELTLLQSYGNEKQTLTRSSVSDCSLPKWIVIDSQLTLTP